MAKGGQLVFDWPHRPALGRDDYLVSSCNEDAVGWIDLWPDWSAPALIICGPPGCGKSHLAAVWQANTGAKSLDPAALPDFAAIDKAECHHFLLENGCDVTNEDGLFHLYNEIVERGGTLLLTAEKRVAGWGLRLPDLESRLRAAPTAQIGMPDDSLIEALLVKMSSDRQLDIAPDVISYLIPRMERSFAATRQIVAKLDDASLAQQRTITVPLARTVLQENHFDSRLEK